MLYIKRQSVHKNPNQLQSRAIPLLQICEKLQVAIPTLILSKWMHIQNLMKFCSFVLKILSGNEILTLIKGHNSLTILRKMTGNNPNLDLVNINAHTNFFSNFIHLFLRYWAEMKIWHQSRAITLWQFCKKWLVTIPT